MLKGINAIISPELLKVLCEMGHGDHLVIADGNFPAASNAKRLIRMDGHGVPEVLDAILSLFPLDQYVEKQVSLMEVCKGDTVVPTIWEKYKEIIEKYEPDAQIEFLERFDYYDEAKKAYAIIATSESAQYANVILKKGCIIKK
jgi:L-fucose mutarotase